MEDGSRDAIDGSSNGQADWWTTSHSIDYWNSSLYGKTWLFHMYEVDGGAVTQKISLGGTFKISSAISATLGYEINIGSSDDEIGQLTVNQDVAAPYAGNGYDIGSWFNFRLGN